MRPSTVQGASHCIITLLGHINMSHEAIHTQNRAKATHKDELKPFYTK